MILAAKRGGPRYDIPKTTTEHKSYPIFQNMHYREIVGTVCHVSLVNGWSFQALVKRSQKYSISLLCEHQQPDGKVTLSSAKIYTHALAHLEITHPRGASPIAIIGYNLPKTVLWTRKSLETQASSTIHSFYQHAAPKRSNNTRPIHFSLSLSPRCTALAVKLNPFASTTPSRFSLAPQPASAAPSPPKTKACNTASTPKTETHPQSEAPSPGRQSTPQKPRSEQWSTQNSRSSFVLSPPSAKLAT